MASWVGKLVVRPLSMFYLFHPPFTNKIGYKIKIKRRDFEKTIKFNFSNIEQNSYLDDTSRVQSFVFLLESGLLASETRELSTEIQITLINILEYFQSFLKLS